MSLSRRTSRWFSGVAATVLLGAGLAAALGPGPAYGTATGPPAFPSDCPAAQYPPAGYSPSATPIPYEVPFKSIIAGGDIDLPPNVVIPDLYASACGLIQLPSLSGTIPSDAIILSPPVIEIAKLEFLPATVKFGTLRSDINLTPAHNGGLDITVSGDTTSSVTTIGMTCGIVLNVNFTTLTSGILSGKPVTGPTMDGQAEVVSNTFAVPPVQTSSTCPPSIAQTFNKLLGLPTKAGVGTFVAPFCFDFELEGPNSPKPTKECPWPSS